ncbi:hypothetical protein QJS10_CPB21g01181 [Acorus calamus]|uniref:Uncharacterized protein n=1 Tax=Acorus calamus TaxID=4465 RepID=A0AAV9C6D4_ACOCL|nr:hypothetical protein QJS10_CPB21g01181 [Acorus calamus]
MAFRLFWLTRLGWRSQSLVRRESPWKVDGESMEVSSKLKLLEQELLNSGKVWRGELSSASFRYPSHYQGTSGVFIPGGSCKSSYCQETVTEELEEMVNKFQALEVTIEKVMFCAILVIIVEGCYKPVGGSQRGYELASTFLTWQSFGSWSLGPVAHSKQRDLQRAKVLCGERVGYDGLAAA